MERYTLKIKTLAGVKINLILSKFNKQITFLKRNNVEMSEIFSDIHFVILHCSQNYNNSRGGFYNYLYSSLKSNFNNKINEILRSRIDSKLTDSFEYNTQDPLCVLISKYPEVYEYITFSNPNLSLDINIIDMCEENA